MNDRIGPKKVENEKTVELRSFIAASSNTGSIKKKKQKLGNTNNLYMQIAPEKDWQHW